MPELCTNKVQRQVYASRDASAGKHTAVFNEYAIGVNLRCRFSASELFDMTVMRGALKIREQPCVRGNYAACTYAHERN